MQVGVEVLDQPNIIDQKAEGKNARATPPHRPPSFVAQAGFLRWREGRAGELWQVLRSAESHVH